MSDANSKSRNYVANHKFAASELSLHYKVRRFSRACSPDAAPVAADYVEAGNKYPRNDDAPDMCDSIPLSRRLLLNKTVRLTSARYQLSINTAWPKRSIEEGLLKQ